MILINSPNLLVNINFENWSNDNNDMYTIKKLFVNTNKMTNNNNNTNIFKMFVNKQI